MRISVVVQNLGNGGLQDGDGNPDDRWPKLAERIKGAADRVDVVMLTETTDWHRYGHKQLARAMRDLDLDAAPLAPSRSGMGTALLYRQQILGRWARHNPDFGTELLHGMAVTSFDIPGLPCPLSFAPIHISPFSAEQAIIEVNYAATRAYKYGPYAVLGGDVNYAPAWSQSPPPDFSEMRPYNVGSRTVMPAGDFDPSAPLAPERSVARKLAQNGFIDVAWQLFKKTKDAGLLAPTGTDDRIDHGWVSGPLADAVSDYRLLTTPADPRGHHHGLTFTVDTDAIDTSNPWTYR